MPVSEILDQIVEIGKVIDYKMRFPEAEALIPANPRDWGPYMAGAAFASDLPSLDDRMKQGIYNLEATFDLLDVAPTDICYNDRFADVVNDFLKVNAMCGLGDEVGAFAAGAFATKTAEGYMETAVKERATMSVEERFRIEAMKRNAKAAGRDPALVRGVGQFKQNLQPHQRSNPFLGPFSPGKRPIWAYKHIRPLGFIDVASGAFHFPRTSRILAAILGRRVFTLIVRGIIVYYYVKYTLFVSKKILSTVYHLKLRIQIRSKIRSFLKRKQKIHCGLF